MSDLNVEKSVVEAWLRESGALIRENFHKQCKEIGVKKDGSLVTDTDKASEDLIISKIQSVHADHGILSEESGMKKDGEYVWVIDPLDGTSNFASGVPDIGVNLCLTRQGETLLAATYLPLRDEYYFAQIKESCELNGEKVIAERKGRDKTIALAIPGALKGESFDKAMRLYAKLYEKGYRFRQTGSSALELAYVASGRIGAYVGIQQQSWDVLPGQCLVSRAGGFTRNLSEVDDLMLRRNVLVACRDDCYAEELSDIVSSLYG